MAKKQKKINLLNKALNQVEGKGMIFNASTYPYPQKATKPNNFNKEENNLN